MRKGGSNLTSHKQAPDSSRKRTLTSPIFKRPAFHQSAPSASRTAQHAYLDLTSHVTSSPFLWNHYANRAKGLPTIYLLVSFSQQHDHSLKNMYEIPLRPTRTTPFSSPPLPFVQYMSTYLPRRGKHVIFD